MLLDKWLIKNGVNKKSFADSIGTAPATIYQTLDGKRRFSADVAKRIEARTLGEVSRCEAMWPEDYINEEDFKALGAVYVVVSDKINKLRRNNESRDMA